MLLNALSVALNLTLLSGETNLERLLVGADYI
jgi:hypothetical protein